ncbi:MAG: dihydrolipoyl dehydrogenase [candidate division WOR-3 bacterium]
MKYDAIVIGAGPGGYVAGIRLGQLKRKVLVVEKKYIGGVCLNVGCIPTKALIHSAHLLSKIKNAKRTMGLKINDDISYDIETLRKWKDKAVNKLTKGVEFLWKSNGVEWIKGFAKILNENSVEVIKEDGESKIFETENIIIATGSYPAIIPGFEPDGKYIWTSDDAVSLPFIPSKLIILGAGAIGLEFAYIYKNLGSDVEVYELMPQILPGIDKEMADELEKILKKEGIKIYTNAKAKELIKENGKIKMKVEVQNKEQIAEGNVLLLAVGRKPCTAGLNLENINVEIDNRGFIKVDKKRRTNIKNIFAIGDVAGMPLLAHKASREGIVAAEVISGVENEYSPLAVPAVVYTIPELLTVGLSEEEAIQRNLKIKIGKFPFSANGKAVASDEIYGFVKIIVNEENDEIVGIHILGPEASSMAGEASLAVEKRIKAEDLGKCIHPHPTLSEAIMEAAENVHKRAIHIVNK